MDGGLFQFVEINQMKYSYPWNSLGISEVLISVDKILQWQTWTFIQTYSNNFCEQIMSGGVWAEHNFLKSICPIKIPTTLIWYQEESGENIIFLYPFI